MMIVVLNGGFEVQINSCNVPSMQLVKEYTLHKFHLFSLFTKMAHRNP